SPCRRRAAPAGSDGCTDLAPLLSRADRTAAPRRRQALRTCPCSSTMIVTLVGASLAHVRRSAVAHALRASTQNRSSVGRPDPTFALITFARCHSGSAGARVWAVRRTGGP